MEALDKIYKDKLDEIKVMIQESDLLETYLDTEEEEDYKALQDAFEPVIEDLHNEISTSNPMQLIDFEKHLLVDELEGLFLPRILGYSVLRGDVDDKCKYKFSQDHYKDILLYISNSPNFDYIKLRIGQTIEVGFALSTGIWVTDLLDSIANKEVKRFFKSHMITDYMDLDKRVIAYEAYKRQFSKFSFLVSDFPENLVELKKHGSTLMKFLLYRTKSQFDNSTLLPYVHKFLKKKEFLTEPEFIQICMVLGMYFELDENSQKELLRIFNALRKEHEDFENKFFTYYLEFVDDKTQYATDAVYNLSKFVAKGQDDELSKFFILMSEVYEKGYVHEDSVNAIRTYYSQRMGLSNQNRCLRHALTNRFAVVINGLDANAYPEYFELFKSFSLYMDIFANEKFNQNIKYLSLNYVKKLLKFFTDKRGKDYQDIKKFVTATFLEFKFFDDKELTDLFKTRRRNKKS